MVAPPEQYNHDNNNMMKLQQQQQQPEDDDSNPATTPNTSATTLTQGAETGGGTFPPCTADKCHVQECDKQAAVSKSRPSCEMTEKCVNACAAYGRVCPCVARIASHAACDAMHELQTDSRIFSSTGKPDFTYINAEDIQIGKKLGEGGFSYVNECTVVRNTTAETDSDQNGDQPETNENDNTNNNDDNENCPELAVKYLKRKVMVDLHSFKHGAADLAVEAYFLQTLRHPNIVQLHGITAGSVETNVATGKECGFFIIVDRLHETLERKIEQWRMAKRIQDASTTFLSRRSAEYKETKRAELLERCSIALEIARAMEYLHSLKIIFRDLKPDNIGFDKNGVLKLFDFGLAKELKHVKEDGTYELTGRTGSRRYMAPEVAQDMDYNQSVDVYSFGILLWELCTSEKPFYGYSSNKHMQLVVLGGERPKMDSQHTHYWPAALQTLMKKCWSADPSQRPSFSQIIKILEETVCHSCGGGDESRQNHTHNHNHHHNRSEANLPEDGGPSTEEDGDGCSSSSSSLPTSSPHAHRSFPRLFPVLLRGGRSKSTDVPSSAALQALKPHKSSSNNNTRARSWGFTTTSRR